MGGAGRTLTWCCRRRRDGADLRPVDSDATFNSVDQNRQVNALGVHRPPAPDRIQEQSMLLAGPCRFNEENRRLHENAILKAATTFVGELDPRNG